MFKLPGSDRPDLIKSFKNSFNLPRSGHNEKTVCAIRERAVIHCNCWTLPE